MFDRTGIHTELFYRGQLEPVLPRKEVIQPQVPLRLPCYDFIPITKFTFDHVIAGFGCPRLS